MCFRKALISYHTRDFDESRNCLSNSEASPHRLTTMDTYSNILYVKEERSALSFLAHNAENNKYCPETCCIGNYYSLKAYTKSRVVFSKGTQTRP